MPAYLVTLPEGDRFTLPQNVTDMVVFASDPDDAKATAAAEFTGDSNQAWNAATVTEVVAQTDFSGDEWALRVAVVDSSPVVDVTAEGGVLGVVDGIVAGGGTGYADGDVVTVSGGTFTRASTFRVVSTSTGVIQTVELVDAGEYTVAPSTSGNAVTGGAGTGATLNLTTGTDAYANFMAEMVGLLNATSVIANAAVDLGINGVGSSDQTLTVAGSADNLGDRKVEAEFTRNGVAIPSLLGAITDQGVAGVALTVGTADISTVVASNVTATLRE